MSHAPNMTNYYMPYSSYGDDTDDDDESDLESQLSDLSEDLRVRQEQDPRYAILRKPTITRESQIAYTNQVTGLGGAPWDEKTNITSLEDMVYLVPPKTTKTSLISIKSTNRDRSVFPTPFNFQLKLPRVYKNVTKFQLVQLSFPNSSNGISQPALYLSSFIEKMLNDGVPSTCIVSCINVLNCTTASNGFGMMEQGRVNGAGQPLLTTVGVAPGSYTDLQLAQELTAQGNNTPPLNLISYTDFRDTFMATRDISVLFNEPGDIFFSKTNHTRYGQHSKEQIMNTYYTQRHIDGLPDITEPVAFVAYYFPVLKEALATGLAGRFIQVPSALSFEDMTAAVMGPFEGLDSPLYYAICSTNQSALDVYRGHLTFELRSVNKYTWRHDNNRFISLHDTLHTSIVRDIAKAVHLATQQELATAGLTAASFATLKTATMGYAAMAKHLEGNLSSCLAAYHLGTGYQYRGGSTHVTAESTFTVADLAGDEQFTTMFAYTSTFGRLYGNYAGTQLQFRDFYDYHSTLSSYYGIHQSTQGVVHRVNTNAMATYHTYVSTKYARVLPAKMMATRSYLSNQSLPVSFVTDRAIYVPGHHMDANANVSGTIQPVEPSTQLPAVLSGPPTNLVVYPPGFPIESTSMTPIGTSFQFDQESDVSLPTVDSSTSNVVVGLSAERQTLRVADTTYGGDCSQICCTYINHLMMSWYSCLPTNLVIGRLTYRLGLMNLTPMTVNLLSTVAQITSTGNLNFFMSINEEQGFNNMDVVMNENYAVSNDTTGQVKLMAAKILMGNVGDTGISQTLIQNPSIFETTLGKLDRLSVKIYYDDDALTPAWEYLPFLLDINEWDATFQCDESYCLNSDTSGWGNRPSVPVPKNPDDTPYLAFSKRNNPNNV